MNKDMKQMCKGLWNQLLAVCVLAVMFVVSGAYLGSVSAADSENFDLYSDPFSDAAKDTDGLEGLGVCDGTGGSINSRLDPKVGNLRWSAQEPNVLAHLPIREQLGSGMFLGGVAGYKHHSLVFQSQVRDIEAPFLEPAVPYTLNIGRDEGEDLPNDPRYGANIEIPQNSPGQLAADIALRDTFLEAATFGQKYYGESTDSNPHPSAQSAIVGPRGCNIGGWYEMMLYQARCIRWFKLNCICDYEKTFRGGSAEAFVLLKGGKTFKTSNPYVNLEGGWGIFNRIVVWPLAWRGYAGPEYAPNATAGSKLWDKQGDNPPFNPTKKNNTGDDTGYFDPSYQGLDEAKVGDFMIYDETIQSVKPAAFGSGADDVEDARYRRHISVVTMVRPYNSADKNSKPKWIQVQEWNYGKNQDSCGNTDRWKVVTVRKITQDEEIASKSQPCDDPDWLNCYEKNWKGIKLYRPKLDVFKVNGATPPVATGVPECGTINGVPVPTFITDAKTNLEKVKDHTGAEIFVPNPKNAEEWAEYTPYNVLNQNIWKRSALRTFDEQEVNIYLALTQNLCDPPFPRGNIVTMTSSIPQLTATSVVECGVDEEGKQKACPKFDGGLPGSGTGSSGFDLPSPTDKGFQFSDLCSLLGSGYSSICAIVSTCVTGTDECAITDCMSDIDLASGGGCAQLCSIDPNNQLCVALQCKETPGRACCALFDIPECCDLFNLKDNLIACIDEPSAECCSVLEVDQLDPDSKAFKTCKAVTECSGLGVGDADLTACCKLAPKANQECAAALGCATAFAGGTVSTETMSECCSYFPANDVCMGVACLDNPTQACCSLISSDDDPDGVCQNLMDCGTSMFGDSAGLLSGAQSNPGCCNNFPEMQACRMLSCEANPTLACCAESPAIPGCLRLKACEKIPTNSCCSTFADQNLLSCTALSCLSANPINPPDECCDLAPEFPVCKAKKYCDLQPEPACCAVFPDSSACQGFLSCINNPTASCCVRYTGEDTESAFARTCKSYVECFVNPTERCCNLFGDKIGAACKKLTGCVTGSDLTRECCMNFPGGNSDCSALLACESNPTASCCSRFGTIPSCIKRGECLAEPTFKCCSILNDNTAECLTKKQCNDGPTKACCEQISNDAPACLILDECFINPSPECCDNVLKGDPICKIFRSLARTPGKNNCS